MKKYLSIITVVLLGLFILGCVNEKVPTDSQSSSSMTNDGFAKKNDCITLQNGILTYSTGHYLEDEAIPMGYNIFGYNYQAHMFHGSYANAYLGRDGFPPYDGDDAAYLAANPGAATHWAWPYRNVDLIIKWNDAWLANSDCDDDGALDRHFGFSAYIGSGAWETNHMSGDDENGHWTYFVKIVAVPDDADLINGIWYNADGTEIGPVIWGEFAIILEVESGVGATYVSPAGPGFGQY